MRVRTTKFWNLRETRHSAWPDNTSDSIIKTVAKMFRELTHEKPPRGRQGRLLPQDEHLAVVVNRENGGIDLRQDKFTFENEMNRIEMQGRGIHHSLSHEYIHDNETDVRKLQRLHQKWHSKAKIETLVFQLDDLVSGLMGLGATNVEISEAGYTWRQNDVRHIATMDLDDYHITIEEKSK